VTIQLFLAPAAAGKTAYVLDLVRDAAKGLRSIPRVVVPSYLQMRAWRRRLAEAGGVIGVRVLTFDRLYAECLSAAGEVYTELSEPVQYRLIRAVVDELPLTHYAPLTDRPGFIQVLKELIGELKAARVWPERFTQAVAALGDEPRLRELAHVYAAYQKRLQDQGWADRAGLGWLAVEALEERAPDVGRDWPLLVVDGFDNFTPVQLALLRVLAGRVGRMIVTLTGTADGSRRPLVHRRFDDTRRRLEEALDVEAVPLPERVSHQAPALTYLEANLFRSEAAQVEGTGTVDLIEAPDRAGEVRAALRWLKERLVEDGMRPDEVALLTRDIAPYRPFIQQISDEFGLPIRLIDGLPLRKNPAIAALLDLLRLMLPADDNDEELALPRRPVIEAWRSPYFDWLALPEGGAKEPIGIAPGDADALDAAARWGRVIGGRSQWQEMLDDLAGLSRVPDETELDEERGVPAAVPVDTEAAALRAKFRRFVRRLTPPERKRSYREFVGWLEALIGPDPEAPARYKIPDEPTALQVVAQARTGDEAIADEDVAALQALKDVLRGLVWAEEALGTPPIDFGRFFDELTGAVEAAFYRLPVRPDCEEITVADVIQARGVPFRAVAVLGIAEGAFPATLSEDPFLRDADRARLNEWLGCELEPSTASAEAEYFYEMVTRPRDKLLLTRPRLADTGARWQASPFWEEMRHLIVEPEKLVSASLPSPARAASWPELMEALATCPDADQAWAWVKREAPARRAALEAAERILAVRHAGATGSAYDGYLGHLRADFARRFGTRHTWSASRLETYRTCPFFFFIGKVLGLEPREEPEEGLDARQLGTIYHRIFEHLYQTPAVEDPTDLDQLLDALPDVAQAILDEAPQREGFRETAWWVQTRKEIVENVQRSLEALDALRGAFVPYQHEAPFGLQGEPPLVMRDGGDQIRLRGFIDRVDRTPEGHVRVIDYKTAGPYDFKNYAVRQGKKLQLPLYALAAREALGLGEVVDGFYWHVRHAEPSSFTLEKFGPEEAVQVAVEYAWEAVRGARRGFFVPRTPDGGCPTYCPAAAFCWHYQPRFGG